MIKTLSVRHFFILILGLFFAFPIFFPSCKSRKFSLSRQQGLATASELRGVLKTSVSLNSIVQNAGDIVFVISTDNPDQQNMFSQLSMTLTPATPDLFKLAPLRMEASLSVERAGSEIVFVNRQAIDTDTQRWGLAGKYLFQNGDVIKLIVHDVPEALKNSSVYFYADVRKTFPPNINDQFAKSGSFSSNESTLANAANFTSKTGPNIDSPALLEFQNNLIVFGLSIKDKKPYFEPNTNKSNVHYCGSVPPVIQFQLNFQDSGKATNFPLKSDSKIPCNVNSNGLIFADNGPFEFVHEVSGLEVGNTLIQDSSSVRNKLGLSGSTPISPNAPIVIRNANQGKGAYFHGRLERNAEVSFRLDGVEAKTGLKLNQLAVEVYVPLNVDPAAFVFDGKGIEAQLLDSAGTIVTDVAKTEIGRMYPTSVSGKYVSFAKVGFPDIADGNYKLVLVFPDSLVGAYITTTLGIERLNSFVDTLSDAVISDFQARDGASTAFPHEWKNVNYSELAIIKPENVAMTETLRYMEEARDTFHLTTNEVNSFTKSKPIKTQLNAVSMDTIEDCLGNQAMHWSDLTIHYYCLHADLRRCYTGAIKDTGPSMEKVKIEESAKGLTGDTLNSSITCRLPTMPSGLNFSETPFSLPSANSRIAPVVPLDPSGKFPTLRNYAYYMCALPWPLALPKKTTPTNMIPGCLANSDIYAYAPTTDVRKSFEWLTKDTKRGTMFRYMMDAPTFGFNDEDQQEIINKFWRVTNPADPKDCAKRPARAIDPKDGTHCLPNSSEAKAGKKVQRPLQTPVGR